MSNNNLNRRLLINHYLNLVEENNNNITQMVNVMNNQENTLRRLLFENENRLRTVFSPPINTRFQREFTNVNLRSPQNNNVNRSLNSLLNMDNLLDSFFDTVPVVPTRQQINSATRNYIFSDISEPLNNSCPISLRRFQNDDEVTMIRFCSHIFSQDDLENWFQTNCRCPLCRFDIRTYIPPSENNNL